MAEKATRQLVYMSRAVKLMSSDELLGLLRQARARNAYLGITGMLLYKDQSFLQLLEGPDHAVNDVYQSILADERHTRMKSLLDTKVEHRAFKRWSMGFQNLDLKEGPLPEAYTDFFRRSSDEEFNLTSAATDLLHSFRKLS